MARNPYFDILFEPVRIGPVTTKNRFYQVPHATAHGYKMPNSHAGVRAIKAEGGWGVVNTDLVSIHPTSDDAGYPYLTIWDDADIAAHALMVEKVHEHGALAGIELWHGGASVANLYSREAPMGAESGRAVYNDPVQSRIVNKSDIKEIRRWYVAAARRGKAAGFDIIYVYATHDYLIHSFLSSKRNFRSDEYGGSVENRVRLLRELIEDVKNVVGDTCAVAVRFCADGGLPRANAIRDGSVPEVEEQKEMLSILAELPDLWDLTVSDYSFEMGASRFVKEASLENYVSYVKSITSKPVVCVGRFTSPNTMVAQVKSGIVDLIGAARPSIADPFLPNKINEGREDEIRECIGCNICWAHDNRNAPIRCTQNPTMGEEWRRGWHPEKIGPKKSDYEILIVGAGPAGMEAAVSLGKRGYRVHLAEATRELGGRVLKESMLPTLSEWNRIYECRFVQLEKLDHVVVMDVVMSETAEMADIVLPACTFLEQSGVGDFPPVAMHGLPYIMLRKKAIEPLGESMPDWKIWSELGRKMGYGEYFPWETDEEMTEMLLEPSHVTLKQLMDEPGGFFYTEKQYDRYKKKGFRTPSGKIEIFSETFKEAGFDPIPDHIEPTQSPVNNRELAEEYPLILTTGARTVAFFHSEHRQIPSLRRMNPDPLTEIHPETAANLGIKDGDWIYIENRYGKCKQ